MNCRTARANFSDYIEEELSELERRAVGDHLRGCARCGSDLAAMQKAMSLLRWVPRPEGSYDFNERLMARIRAEEREAPAAAPGWFERGLDDMRQWYREIWASFATPAPAMALLAAFVMGGGGVLVAGNFIGANSGPSMMGMSPARSQDSPAAATVSTADASAGESKVANAGSGPARDMAAPSETPRTELVRTEEKTATGGAPSTGQITQLAGDPASAPRTTPAARVPSARSRAARPRTAVSPDGQGIEIAEWAAGAGGDRLEALPEGPPPISRVEYVLDQVAVSRRNVTVTGGVRAQEGSITF